MTGRVSLSAWLLGLAWLGCAAGCSDVPKGPPRPSVAPAEAAREALAMYDADHDGKLDAKELEKSPPLAAMLAAIKRRDPNHENTLTADDIVGRINAWLHSGVTLMGGTATVDLDGEPLADATVIFEPEPWLGPAYHSHTGTTGPSGIATMTAALENFPGIYVGLYRVKISKKAGAVETVPERYNEKTTLGVEVALDSPSRRELFHYSLKSR